MSEIAILRDVPMHGSDYQLPLRGGDARLVQVAQPADLATVARDQASVERAAADVEARLREAYEKGFADGKAAVQAQVEARIRAAEDEMGAQAELAREKAEQAGWQTGLAKAVAEADQRNEEREREAEAALQKRLSALDDILRAGSLAWANRIDALEEDAVALCHSVVCRIVGTAAGDASATRAIVKQALAELAEPAHRIVLHPADLADLGDDLEAAFSGVRWETSNQVERGTLRVVGHGASLDARLTTQMEAFRAELMRVYAAPRTSEDAP